MSKMRVVIGINDLLVGGAQRQVIEHLSRFDRERFEVILITLFHFPHRRQWYDLLPQDIVVHRLSFKGWWDLRSWYRLSSILASLRPDIVVSHLFFSNMVFRTLGRFVGYVAIACEHNTYVGKPFLQRLVDRLLASHTHTVVAVSNTVAAFTAAQEHIDHNKFTVIHNGVDTTDIRERIAHMPGQDVLKEQLGFSSQDKILLNVGRLTPQKKPRLLVEGFVRFISSHPDYRLVFVGEGPLQAELRELSRVLGVGERVTFAGHTDNVWQYYAVAHALVSPSAIEGLSIAYLEALAAGVPLVATKTAGTDELIDEGNNGFYITDLSPQGVAASLERLRDADHEALQRAAQKSAERFDIAATVRKYQDLIVAAARGRL